MEITKNGPGTMTGPGEWFAGNVYIDVVSMPSPTSRVMGGIVHFAPGARTAWHTHPAGQTIFVTEGAGLVQREGGPVEEVRTKASFTRVPVACVLGDLGGRPNRCRPWLPGPGPDSTRSRCCRIGA
jgi:hypothetical protein